MTDRYKPPSQKVSTPVLLVDPATGEAYTSGSPLPVSSTPPVGGATEAKQDDIIAALAGALTVSIDQTVFGTTNAVYLAGVNSGAANLGKLEDSASASGDLGVAMLGVRQANPLNTSDTDGDYEPLRLTGGRLWVTGAYAVDAIVQGTDLGIGALVVRDDALSALTPADGDYTHLRVDSTGALWVAGSQIEDAAHASGDRGVMALGVRTDTAAALAGTTGDYQPFIFDNLGKLWVTGTYLEDAVHATGDKGSFVLAVRADTPAATGANGDYVAFIVDANGKLWVTGTYLTDAAAGAGDQVTPAGAVRDDALTALTPVDGDYDRLRVDKWGRLHVRESLDEYETVAASATDQALGATGAAGDILSHVLIVPATLSPGAVSIKDGAGSAITIFTGGASSVLTLDPITVPLGIRSATGAWSVTTGANVSAIAVGDFT